jgi:type III secretion protein HrpB1
VKNDEPVRKDLTSALVSILSQGIQDNALDDAEELLAAIKFLNPALQGIDEFGSYIAIKRGFVRDALRTYNATPADTSKWYVMMALCLKLAGDPTWHWHAEQSLERHDVSAKYSHDLARILLGRDAVVADAEAKPAVSEILVGKAAEPHFSDSFVNYLSV